MISVYLCDDEPIWIKRINKAIKDYQIKSDWELIIKYQATSPEALLQYLTEHPPMNGIYFLDIDFKTSIDGLYLAKQIRNMDPQSSIVFITTHEEMVMETFRLKLEVLDYIIKNVSPLTDQIHQCLQHHEDKFITMQKDTIAPIIIRVAGSYHAVFPQEIYYVETIKNAHKVCLHLQSTIYHFTDSLSSLQKRLGEDFVHCHKTCLVNVRHIRELDYTNRQAILHNGDCCSCSIREWKKMVTIFSNPLPLS